LGPPAFGISSRRRLFVNLLSILGAWPVARAGSHRSVVTPASQPLFREVSAEVGLDFWHFTGATGEYYFPENMGAGVALFDYDNDGDLDIYFAQGMMLDHNKKPLFPPPRGWRPGDRLFRNMLKETDKLQFVDVTEQAGLTHAGFGMGVAVGDYDNDGYLDLYVTRFGNNVLYHNNGNGTFTDVMASAGVDDPRWSASAAFFDYDNDGLLDLFVTNYVDFTILSNQVCRNALGAHDYCNPSVYHPVPARLFHNEGNGRFREVTESSGIGAVFGRGLGVACGDFDSDGLLDVFVANDGTAKQLGINHKDGNVGDRDIYFGVSYKCEGNTRINR